MILTWEFPGSSGWSGIRQTSPTNAERVHTAWAPTAEPCDARNCWPDWWRKRGLRHGAWCALPATTEKIPTGNRSYILDSD